MPQERENFWTRGSCCCLEGVRKGSGIAVWSKQWGTNGDQRCAGLSIRLWKGERNPKSHLWKARICFPDPSTWAPGAPTVPLLLLEVSVVYSFWFVCLLKKKQSSDSHFLELLIQKSHLNSVEHPPVPSAPWAGHGLQGGILSKIWKVGQMHPPSNKKKIRKRKAFSSCNIC